MALGREKDDVPSDVPGCCRTAWTKLPCCAKTCPAPLQRGQVAFLVPLGDSVGPRTAQSLQELPKCGGQGQPGPNRAGWVCPAGHWGDQRGDTPPSVTPGDRGLPASTATLCCRAGGVLLNYFKPKPKNTSLH